MKILYITTIGMTMGFFKSFIRQLIDEGHTVDIACNQTDSRIPEYYQDWGCKAFHISCSRSPLNKGNIDAVKQIKRIVSEGKYDIVHCHTPIAAACTRLACKSQRSNGVKVIYTAHGFHFYKGASILNWLLYYPVEKLCAHWTDVLITINKEDYTLAQRKLKAKSVKYVPGVGIDTQKFTNTVVCCENKRKELGVPVDSFLLLSVGELNENKNHEVVIKAMSKIKNSNVHYAIAGTGPLHDYLINLATILGVEKQLHLLGYRTDVAELYKMADVCVFPSIREGLGLAAIEGMSSGLALIVSDNRGTRDYSVQNHNALICKDHSEDDFAKAIQLLYDNNVLRNDMGHKNQIIAEKYGINNIIKKMKEIYFEQH